jgi:predicted NBD/HSP70 family sugar kinase
MGAPHEKRNARVHAPVRFGIDLGGTKTEIVALAPDGRELLRRRVATPRDEYGATLDALARLVVEVSEAGRGGTVGLNARIDLPRDGPSPRIDPVCLNGQPIKRFEEAAREVASPTMRTASRWKRPTAPDATRVAFGAILGTGVGAGIVADGPCSTA